MLQTYSSFLPVNISGLKKRKAATIKIKITKNKVAILPLFLGGTSSFFTSGFGLLGDDINTTLSIDGDGTVKKYRLFIWLDEVGDANNAEQGATFKGTIHVDLPGAKNITGEA